jgi:hypothetical protein
VAALLASSSIIIVVAGWALIVGSLLAMGLYAYAATMNRMSDGQGAAGAIFGGVTDVTPVAPIWQGATGTDIVTGEDLGLSADERAAQLGFGLGTVTGMLLGRPVARWGGKFGKAYVNCFVAGTQVVMDEETADLGAATDAALAESDDGGSDWLLGAGCLAIGAVGAAVAYRRQRRRRHGEYQAAVDDYFAGGDSDDLTLPDFDPIEREPTMMDEDEESSAAPARLAA